MVEFRVSLPIRAVDYIREQVASGRNATVDELLTDLIDKHRNVAASDRLAELILEGEKSGEGVEMTDEWWERRTAELRAEAERRHAAH